MRPRSVVGPLVLIAIGGLFLAHNLHPEMSLISSVTRYWPFLLIGWGALRLIEILIQAGRGRPLPVSGVSGGEWTLVVFLTLFGSSLFFVHDRMNWPPVGLRMKGIEVFGKPYDYAFEEKTVASGATPRVIVENSYGNARIAVGTTDEVRVSGRKTVRAFDSREAEETGRSVQLEVRKEGDAVIVRAVQMGDRDRSFVATDLEITVPKGTTIEGSGRRGDFDITGINGRVQIDSDNAGVRLQDIGGDVRIELRASDIVRAANVKGAVEVRGSGQDVEIEDVQGQVTVAGNYYGELSFRNIVKPVKFEGGLKSRTSEFLITSCPGTIRMGRGNLAIEDVKGPVVINAKSKDVQISNFTDSLELRVERGDVEIRAGQAPLAKIDAVTNGGNIELTLPENGRFNLKAVTERGEVENDYGDALTRDGENIDGRRSATLTGKVGDGPSVSVRTERGDVRVRKGSPLDPPRAPVPPPPPKPLVVEKN